ncbi:MAG: putative manganese-dependent inorganic diphosphatase [Verrucomicrobia subdivision 3 bacterium]|nr:putative manganese-dependent inorganic diphosphatase [Limisphaerales bacterium]
MSQSPELLVIGHRNPDTDAICSAIAYAEFKRRTGALHAVAARCGDTNERIDFVLNYFGVPAPRFVADVSPKVRDVMQPEVVSVSAESTLSETLGLMDELGIRAVPILNKDRVCQGLVSVFKMSQLICPAPNRLIDSRRVVASIANLARTLDASVLHATRAEEEQELVLMIGGMAAESFATRLTNYPPERLLVVVGDRRDIQELAIKGKARLIVVTGGLPVDTDIIDRAREQGVSVVVSPHDTATTALMCRTAVTVKHMAQEKFQTFNQDEPLTEVEPVAAGSRFLAFPVVDERGTTVGILSKSDFLKKVERQLILVDHNELSQAVPGASQVEIVEVIDHHRIGAMTTVQPILFRNEPVGSTSTIVADCFLRSHVDLPQPIAGLLLAGIISDTLNLTSPTTTPRDADILKQLEWRCGVKAAEFTEKLFASGSVLTSLPPPQAIVADCKEFHEQGRNFSVAQIEELGFDQFWKRKQEVVAALEEYRREKGYFFSALMVTDVARNSSLLLVAGARAFLKQIDYPSVEPGIFELEGIVSRKKQLLPYLTHCLENGTGRRAADAMVSQYEA